VLRRQNNLDMVDTARSDETAGTDAPSATTRPQSLVQFLMQDKVTALLWLTRLFTIITAFMFIFPFFGYDSNTLYQKVLMSSAATSALRLHQRLAGVPFQFNYAYFKTLLAEDSFHYLLYSLIFLNTHPITIVLMPVCAFALLHFASYTNNVLNHLAAQGSLAFIRKIINAVCSSDKDIMRFVAINEIILMPSIILMIFIGKCGIFMPFIYYRFLCMRYQSRRNPYNQTIFRELRQAIDYYSAQPNCPQMLRTLVQRAIQIIARFAPQQVAA